MLQKLKNTAGETFVEALAALLIMGFSTVLFLGLINAAKNVNLTQKEADARFFQAMNQVEAMDGTATEGTSKKIDVQIWQGTKKLETIKCEWTEAENLRAYQIEKP